MLRLHLLSENRYYNSTVSIMIKFLAIISGWFLSLALFAQSDTLDLLRPDLLEGLSGLSLDETRLTEVQDFEDYIFIKEEHGWNHYFRSQTGVTLVTHQLDVNQTIRSVEFAPEKDVVLSNGLWLNESSLEEVESVLEERNFYSDSPRVTHEGRRYFFGKKMDEFVLNRIEFLSKEKISDRVNFRIDSSFFDSLNQSVISFVMDSPPGQIRMDSIAMLLFGKKHWLQDSINRWIDDSTYQVRLVSRRLIFPLSLNVLFAEGENGRLKPLLHNLCVNRDTGFLYSHEYLPEGLKLKWHRDLNVNATVGYFCSVGGSPPAMMEKVFTYIEGKEPGQLLRLLYSPSPELQAYGLLGVHFYRFRYGWEISEAITQRMDWVYNFNPRLQACLGCNYGTYPLQYMVNYEDLHRYFKNFRRSRFIR